MDSQNVMVEIVAKKKGCILCDLALAILEEIAPEFEKGVLQWEVVDVSSREGVMRHAELGAICKRMPAVPSIIINERIAFDNIPDMEALSAAISDHRQSWGYEDGTWKGPGPPLLLAADFLKNRTPEVKL